MSQASTSPNPFHSHSKSNSQSKSAPNERHNTLRTSVLDAAVKLGLDNPQVAGWLFNPISEEGEESDGDSQPPLTADRDDSSVSADSPLPRTPEIQQVILATARDPRLYSPNAQSPALPSATHHPVGAHLYALGPQPHPQKPKLRKAGPPPAGVLRESPPVLVDKDTEKKKKKEAKEREKEAKEREKERGKGAKEREKEAREREKEIKEREKERERDARDRESRKETQIDDDASGKKSLMSKFRLKSKERKISDTPRSSSPPPPVPVPVPMVLPIAALFAAKPAEDLDPARDLSEANRAPASTGGSSDQLHSRDLGSAGTARRYERAPSSPWSKPLDGTADEGGDRSTYYVPAPVPILTESPPPPRRQPSSPMLTQESVKPLVIRRPYPSPSQSPSHSPTHSESSDRVVSDLSKQKSRGGGFMLPNPSPSGLLGMGRTKSPSHSPHASEDDSNDHSHSPVTGSLAHPSPPDLPPSNRSKPRPTAMQFQAGPVSLAVRTVVSSTPVTQTHDGQRSSTAALLLDVSSMLPPQRRPVSPLSDNGRPLSPASAVGRPRSPENGRALPPPSFGSAFHREAQETPFSAPLQNHRRPSASGWPAAIPHSAQPQSSTFIPISPLVSHSALPQSSAFLAVDSLGAQLSARPSLRGRMPAFPSAPTNPGAVTRTNTRTNGLSPRPRINVLEDDGSGAFLPPHPDQPTRPLLTRQTSQKRQGLLSAPPSINIDTTDDEALQVFPRRKDGKKKTRRAVRFEMDLSDDEDFRRREPHGPLPTIIIPGHLHTGSQVQPQTREARRQSFLDLVENNPPANRLQPGVRPVLAMGNNRRRSTYYSSHDGGYNSDGASTEASRLSDYARSEAVTDRNEVDKHISTASGYSEQLNRLSKFIAGDRIRPSSYLEPNDRLSVFTSRDRLSKVTLGSRVSFADSRLSAVSDFDVAAYYGIPGSDEKKRADGQDRRDTLDVDKERQREVGRNRLVRMLTPPKEQGRVHAFGGRI